MNKLLKRTSLTMLMAVTLLTAVAQGKVTPAGTVIAEPEAKQIDGYFSSQSLDDALLQRMTGKSLPADKRQWAKGELRYLRVLHRNIEGKVQIGEIVCNKGIASDLLEIFRALYDKGYKIERMVLVDEYGGNDDLSMKANNTSCFNYRTVAGTNRLSNHGKGLAIDINPFYNPWVRANKVDPPAARPYAFNRSKVKAPVPIITPSDICYNLFRKHGFTWGGAWRSSKDYQHFEKTNK